MCIKYYANNINLFGDVGNINMNLIYEYMNDINSENYT